MLIRDTQHKAMVDVINTDCIYKKCYRFAPYYGVYRTGPGGRHYLSKPRKIIQGVCAVKEDFGCPKGQ